MRSQDENLALTEWCKSLIIQGKYADAEMFASILHSDDDVNSLVLLTDVLRAKKDYKTALEVLDETLSPTADTTDEDRCQLLMAKASIMAAKGEERAALQVLLEAQKVAKFADINAGPELDLKIGSLLIRLKEFEVAQSIFNTDFEIGTGQDAPTQSSIVDCMASHSSLPSRDLKTYIKHEVKSTAECVYLVAGDVSYCRYFAERLARQLGTLTQGNVHLHIHGIITNKDDPGTLDAAWRLIENSLKAADAPLTFTRRSLEMAELTDGQRASVYAAERFRMLPEILKLYDLPVIVSDIDQLPLFDPSTLLSDDDDFDVSFAWNKSAALDVTSIASSEIVVFNTSFDALKFAEALSAYFETAFAEPRRLHKKLDQTGLAITKYRFPSIQFKAQPFGLTERSSQRHVPALAYSGAARFIGTGTDQTPQEFAAYLDINAAEFTELMFARYMGTNGHPLPAAEMVTRYLNDKKKRSRADKFEAHLVLGLINVHAGKLEAAHDSLEKALDVLPKGAAYDRARSVTLYQFASVKAALGQTSEAQLIFEQKMPTDCGNGWVTDSGIIDFQPALDTSSPVEMITLFENANSVPADCVYLVAADIRYCQQFVPALVAQIETLKIKNVHLHIHGILSDAGDGAQDDQDWKTIQGILEDSPVFATLTTASCPQKGLSAQKRKAIYASERFRLLPSLLQQYNLPIIIADIDQLPLQNPSKLLRVECDAQLLYSAKSVLNFLSVVSATLSVFYPTVEGGKMASALKAYLDRAYSNSDKLNWHVDQAALAVIHTLFDDANIVHFETNVVETDPNLRSPNEALENGALFWSVTNSIEGNSKLLAHLDSQNDILIYQ